MEGISGAHAGNAGTVPTPKQSGQVPAQNQGIASNAETDAPIQSETQSESAAHNCGKCGTGHQVGQDSISCNKRAVHDTHKLKFT